MKEERRQKIVFISDQQLLTCILGYPPQADTHCVIHAELPADFSVVGVHQDYSRAAFAFIIESSSFEPVPMGEMIPILETSTKLISKPRFEAA